MPYAVAQIWGFETGKAVFAAVFDLYFAADHPVKREVSAVSAFTDSGKLPDQRLYHDFWRNPAVSGSARNAPGAPAIVISIVIGMIGAGHIVGIGIGTVVAMICTGRVIAVFNHFLKKKIEMSVMWKDWGYGIE